MQGDGPALFLQEQTWVKTDERRELFRRTAPRFLRQRLPRPWSRRCGVRSREPPLQAASAEQESDRWPQYPCRSQWRPLLRRSGTKYLTPPVRAHIEATLELWASSLRDVKERKRPLFTQERVAASAGAFLDGLLGNERRKTGWMRAEAAGDPGPWRQQAILGRGRWEANDLRDIVRGYALDTLADDDAVLVFGRIEPAGIIAWSVWRLREPGGYAADFLNGPADKRRIAGIFWRCSGLARALLARQRIVAIMAKASMTSET